MAAMTSRENQQLLFLDRNLDLYFSSSEVSVSHLIETLVSQLSLKSSLVRVTIEMRLRIGRGWSYQL